MERSERWKQFQSRMRATSCLAGVGLAVLGCGVKFASAADLASQTCNEDNKPAFCQAVPGDRSQGWMAQSHSETMARNGMVTTSQPLAAEAGLDILKQGGNAVDAAVATAAVLNLMEPMNTGLAGDLFAIIYTAADHQLHVLNASGMAPSGLTIEFMNSHGYEYDPENYGPGSGMPKHGVLDVTVPGAAWGWQEVLDKYGTMTFKETLTPAIFYAEQGFPVSERIAHDWKLPTAQNADPGDVAACCTDLDPDTVDAWYIDGKQPHAGQIYKNPDLAKTFRLLQEQGRDAFYTGEMAQAIVDKVHKLGGTMTMEDLANYQGEWMEPVMSDYHGYQLAELPPPSQAWATNEILSILAACTDKVYPGETLASMGPADARYWHMVIEAKTLAYKDLYEYNGDPDSNPGLLDKVKTLVSAEHAEGLCSKISADKTVTLASGDADGQSDTIVLSTADRWGNMVSWVNSNYAGFGSGITVPGYGFVLHNRGGLFTLNPDSPNAIAPGKRPFNTLSAGFVMQDGNFDGQLMTLLLMGGDMQPQGHAQVMVNMVDLGANLQAATDMARFRHDEVPDTVGLEFSRL